MYDIAIIGAGVVGAMVARELSRYELKTVILEKENDVAMGATKANSAIVHAGFDAPTGSLKAAMNVKGALMMEKVCRELGVKYKKNGSLVIGFSEKDRKTVNDLYLRGVANGVERLEIIEKEKLKTLEPNVSDDAMFALYAPTGAIVCPYELTVAAIGNAMDNGVELRRNYKVDRIEKKEHCFEIYSEKEKVEAATVINCAGMYSDSVAEMIGDRSFDIHARKGEYVLLDKECGKTVSHTIFTMPTKMGKGILVTPTVDGNLLLGPTSHDMGEKDDRRTTSEGMEHVLKNADTMVNNIPKNKVITSFCGLRSVGSTGDFIINTPIRHFVNVAGIESPGLSASPAIAEYVIEMLKCQGIDLKRKNKHTPTREAMHTFRDASTEEKNYMIKNNSSYGKIVCRCEGITEGEILDAIRHEPRAFDLDGVKRRTRAQMGRCQGGFCSPYITELIARECRIPCERVTKSGNGSYLLTGKTKEGCEE